MKFKEVLYELNYNFYTNCNEIFYAHIFNHFI